MERRWRSAGQPIDPRKSVMGSPKKLDRFWTIWTRNFQGQVPGASFGFQDPRRPEDTAEARWTERRTEAGSKTPHSDERCPILSRFVAFCRGFHRARKRHGPRVATRDPGKPTPQTEAAGVSACAEAQNFTFSLPIFTRFQFVAW